MFFLTDIDPNAKVKGARDPLGTQSIWTGFTRRIIGNLTSQTVTLDDFRVLVIGAWIEDQLTGDEVRRGDAFLVWEQLAAYARLEIADQTGFRGVTRAKSFLRKGTAVVSPERVHQLLTNQSAYGISGPVPRGRRPVRPPQRRSPRGPGRCRCSSQGRLPTEVVGSVGSRRAGAPSLVRQGARAVSTEAPRQARGCRSVHRRSIGAAGARPVSRPCALRGS